jgi:hypothetical protein
VNLRKDQSYSSSHLNVPAGLLAFLSLDGILFPVLENGRRRGSSSLCGEHAIQIIYGSILS